MEIKELQTKNIAELSHLLEESRIKLDDLKFKAAQGKLKNIREIRVTKRGIATILMVLKIKVKAETK